MKEIRKVELEFKAVDNDEQELRIQGYAARFNQPETYGYTEVIASGAFDESDLSDVVLRYNHNDSFMVLARTRNDSLKLSTDEKGLYMDATLQKDITDHVNIYNAIKSGLIDKQSFAFTIDDDYYDPVTDTRTITKIGKVYDVSVVDQPFYNATDVSIARSENDEFLEKRKQLREEYEKEQVEQQRKEQLDKMKKDLLSKLG